MFVQQNPEEDLRSVCRHYETSYPHGVTVGTISPAVNGSADGAMILSSHNNMALLTPDISFIAKKRGHSVVRLYNNFTLGSARWDFHGIARGTDTVVADNINTRGFTVTRSTLNNNASLYWGHWTADARL